jgi:lipopolysaccharide transport system ATP-binding protein
MSETLVKAGGVSKKFCKSLKRSMLYGVEDIIKNVLSLDAKETKLRPGEFWAVDGVSFELRRGECIGLIGPNGSGKSTLLKMLNGILMPDRGSIEIKGRVGALIELGAGFHPMLTGRENIYINGAILGFSKKEIEQKFDSIVTFSELADFIDTPVKYYSSGMYVRLGFAVAAHMEPDVLLIDEVLAVGDAGFRAKCYDAIYSILKKAAVIFVSHSMAHINRMCTSVLLLDKGADRLFTNPGEGISAYFDLADRSKSRDSIQHSTGQAAIKSLQVKGATGAHDIYLGKAFEVTFDLWLSPEIKTVSIYLSILSRDLTPVASTKSKKGLVVNTGESQGVHFVSPELTLAPEEYSLSISIFDDLQLNQILWNYNVCFFRVKGSDYFGTPVSLLGNWYSNTKTDGYP